MREEQFLKANNLSKVSYGSWICQVLCVNDLDFVVVVVLGFGVVVALGMGCKGRGAPSLAYPRRKN
jgi:hypothetical protein